MSGLICNTGAVMFINQKEEFLTVILVSLVLHSTAVGWDKASLDPPQPQWISLVTKFTAEKMLKYLYF